VQTRWDGDERGHGVADGRWLLPGVSELVAALERNDWVAEEPEAHLLPHLERACRELPFELVCARTSTDGTFEVDLRWQGASNRIGEIREAVYALAGSIAETATYLRQGAADSPLADERGPRRNVVVFELATGLLAPDTPFAPHGHTVRFRIDRDAAG
jgi:hypothetical protein